MSGLKTPVRRTAPAIDRELPHDLEAERAVLGSMLLNADAIPEVRDVLRAGAPEFWNARNGEIFKTIVSLADDDRPVDGILIRDELIRRGRFEALGGYQYMAELAGSVPSHHHAARYAQVVHEHYIRRMVVRSANLAIDDAIGDQARQLGRPVATVDDVVSRLSSAVVQISELALSRAREDGAIAGDVSDALTMLEHPAEQARGMSTGLFGLDNLTYGLEPGDLVLIGARPSRGKTALGLNIAEYLAVDNEVPILFVSLEMRRVQVASRLICSRARVNGHDAKRGNLTPEEALRLRHAAAQIAGSPLFVFNRVRRLDDIANLARIKHRESGIRAVIIDYLGLIETASRFDRYDLHIAQMTRTLKTQIAEELGVGVVLLAQLNRKVDAEDRPPRMSDFRDSGAIEQDADKIILPWQDTKKVAGVAQGGEVSVADSRRLIEGDVQLIVDKHRNGPTGSAPVVWRPQWARFENPRFDGPELFEPDPFSYRPR